MSFENRSVVDRILTTAEHGLRDFVIRQYKKKYGKETFLNELSGVVYKGLPLGTEVQASSKIESPGWLQAIVWRKEAFEDVIGRDRRVTNPEAKQGFNFADALLLARNRYAHWNEDNSFTDEDVRRLADTAVRLLKVARARKSAAIVEEIQQQFGEILFNEKTETTEAQSELTQEAFDALNNKIKDMQTLLDERNEELAAMTTARNEAKEDTTVAPVTETSSADLPNGNDDDGDSAAPSSEDDAEPIANQVDLSDAKLPNLDWRGRNLRGAKLHKTDLSKGIFCEEDLSQQTFERVNLWQAKLQKSILSDSIFDEVDLRGAKLQKAILSDSIFDKVNLRKADLTKADLRGAILTQPKLSNAILTGAKLEGVTIERTKFSYWKAGRLRATVDLSNLDMTEARFADVHFSGVDMSNVNLTDASFLSEDIEWLAKLGAWQKLEFAKEFYPCRLFRANLTGSNLSGVIAAKVDLKESKLVKANLTGANLQGAHLNKADLTEAKLCESNLILVILTGADLTGADLNGADLWGAALESVKFGHSTKLPNGEYWNDDTDMSKFTAWPAAPASLPR